MLCTTATANDRVVADVADQLRLGHAGALKTYRGPLGRASLRLEVVELPAPGRPARVARDPPPGAARASGIVYTLTKRDADTVAEWLNGHGVPAEAYCGEVDTERRVDVEERLLRNELKAVVATSALGMGYDKPDLGFVVHYQAPGSVISYYQQVGRAGPRDRARRRRAAARRARTAGSRTSSSSRRSRRRTASTACWRRSRRAARRRNELMGAVNLGKGRIEAMLKVLDVEGAVTRDGTTLGARARQRLALRRRPLRPRHRAAPARAGGDGGVRRRRALPDARAARGARRSRPAGLRRLRRLHGAAVRRPARPGARPRGGAAPALAPAHARRQEDGARRRGQDEEARRRRARRGGPRARPARRRRLGPAGPVGPARRALRRRARRGGGRGGAHAGARRSRWVTAVPSTRSGDAGAGLRARGWRPRSACRSTRCSSASATTRRSAR